MLVSYAFLWVFTDLQSLAKCLDHGESKSTTVCICTQVLAVCRYIVECKNLHILNVASSWVILALAFWLGRQSSQLWPPASLSYFKLHFVQYWALMSAVHRPSEMRCATQHSNAWLHTVPGCDSRWSRQFTRLKVNPHASSGTWFWTKCDAAICGRHTPPTTHSATRWQSEVQFGIS